MPPESAARTTNAITIAATADDAAAAVAAVSGGLRFAVPLFLCINVVSVCVRV